MSKYTIDRSELDPKNPASVAKAKAELMDETWWARSSGPDVARNVETFCNLMIHITAAMTPSGETVRFAQNVSAEFGMRVKAQSAKIYSAIQRGDSVMAAIEGGTDELAIQAAQESLKRAGAGQFAAVIDVLKDVQKHAKKEKEAAEFKATVQEQLNRLDDLLAQYANDQTLQRERLEAIEAIKDAVISGCNSLQNAQTYSAPASSSESPLQTTPAVPWWVTALSSMPTVYNKALRTTQAKPTQTPSSSGASCLSSNPPSCCAPGAKVCP
jgi:hypothetical protein